jgi:hypothetical protein
MGKFKPQILTRTRSKLQKFRDNANNQKRRRKRSNNSDN